MHEVRDDVGLIDVLAAAGGADHEDERHEQDIFVLQALFVGLPSERRQARPRLGGRGAAQAVAKNKTDEPHDGGDGADAPEQAAPADVKDDVGAEERRDEPADLPRGGVEPQRAPAPAGEVARQDARADGVLRAAADAAEQPRSEELVIARGEAAGGYR